MAGKPGRYHRDKANFLDDQSFVRLGNPLPKTENQKAECK